MTDQGTTGTATPMPNALEVFRSDLTRMEQQFAAALPEHIPPARFTRVVMTAIQNNPDLLRCSRQSLFNSCMRAAQDGLLPDGREGAIVPFDSERGANTASWLPMIAGLRKKARNSGELSDWYAEVVRDGDEFDYQLGDNPFIFHRPAKASTGREAITHAYSIAVLKDGTKSREVLTIGQIEEIRKKFARSKKGPWNDPVTYPEMCRKTVARRHSKSLPMSSDLDTLLRRDDDLYDFGEAREEQKHVGRPPLATALDYFGQGDIPPPSAPDAAPIGPAEASTPSTPAAAPATPAGPKNAGEYRAYFEAVVEQAKATGRTGDLLPWFNADAQRRMRNACGVLLEHVDEMRSIAAAAAAEGAPK